MKPLSELHALAEAYEEQIKETIAEKFSVSVDELVLLTDKEDGVFISEIDFTTFCCLVLGKESRHLYSVTALPDRRE